MVYARTVRLRVQTVLYRSSPSQLRIYGDALAQALRIAAGDRALTDVVVAVGDCSEELSVGENGLAELRTTLAAGGIDEVHYRPFGQNLGHAGGQARLFDEGDCDVVLLVNPDVAVGPGAVSALIEALDDASVGIAEAHQLPFEHPKEYDRVTGATPWSSFACAATPAGAWRAVGGPDPDSFFLHGDDVDYSWRLRLAGYSCCYVPRARVFHDKRVTAEGAIAVPEHEQYYATEADLMLSYKYSRPERAEQMCAAYESAGTPTQKRAAAAFRRRQQEGNLPEPLDPDGRVACFIDGAYATHRWSA